MAPSVLLVRLLVLLACVLGEMLGVSERPFTAEHPVNGSETRAILAGPLEPQTHGVTQPTTHSEPSPNEARSRRREIRAEVLADRLVNRRRGPACIWSPMATNRSPKSSRSSVLTSRDSMISTVRRALDRCAVVRNCPTEHLRLAAAVIITRGIDGDVFENVEDTHALIAAVVAFANVAPIEVLEQMADIAERERCYAEWWDARGYDESIGAVPELGYDYEAMRAEASVH